MTREDALIRGCRMAEETGEPVFVVYDPAYRDVAPEDAYYLAGEEGVETFFAGAEIVAVATCSDPVAQ